MPYNRIVVALGDINQANTLITKAKEIGADNAEIHIVHVVSPIISSYGADTLIDIAHPTTNDLQQAASSLQATAQQYQIHEDHLHVSLGNTGDIVKQVIEDIQADCLVAGSTGRKGLDRLLFSTSTDLLKTMPCDGLFVNLKGADA